MKGSFFQGTEIRKGLCSRNPDFFETASGAFLFGTSHSRIMFHSVLVFQVCSLSLRTPVHPRSFAFTRDRFSSRLLKRTIDETRTSLTMFVLPPDHSQSLLIITLTTTSSLKEGTSYLFVVISLGTKKRRIECKII